MPFTSFQLTNFSDEMQSLNFYLRLPPFFYSAENKLEKTKKSNKHWQNNNKQAELSRETGKHG
jgi:trehalose-6-phosphatase